MYNSSYNPGRQSMSKTRSDRKKRKQRKRRIILWLFTFFVFIVALAVLFLTCFFKIKVIKVSGVTRYSSEQIVENCGIKIDDNMLLVLQNNVKKTLSAKLPYIDDVKLIKKLDSSIEIRVTDAKEAYSIESGNNYYLLSEKLVVLETSTNPFENTVQLRGLEEQNYIVGSAVKISNTSLNETFSKLLSLIEENEIDINLVDISDNSNFMLMVENKYIVNLGTNSYLEKKIAHLKAMLEKINDDSTGVIDLSYWSPENTEGYFKSSDIDQYLKKQ